MLSTLPKTVSLCKPLMFQDSIVVITVRSCSSFMVTGLQPDWSAEGASWPTERYGCYVAVFIGG